MSIRICYNREIRLVPLTEDGVPLTYTKFMHTVSYLFPVLAGKEFSLAWEDDEGDEILCSSERKFDEAFLVMKEQGKHLRFNVKLDGSFGQHALSHDKSILSVMGKIHSGSANIRDPMDNNSYAYLISFQTLSFPTVQLAVNEKLNKIRSPFPVNELLVPEEIRPQFMVDCLNVSIQESCSLLMTAFNHALSSPAVQSNESVVQMNTVIDACLHIYSVVMRNPPKRAMTISTSGKCMPGYSNEYLNKYPLIVGLSLLIRNYREGIYGYDPKLELISKTPFASWKRFYPYIFGYFALGDADTNLMHFGILHPSLPYFTQLFEGNILELTARTEFCLLLLRLIPVLCYLTRCARLEISLGLRWSQSRIMEGMKKSLKIVIIHSVPVVEITWTPLTLDWTILHEKIAVMKPVYNLLCQRRTSDTVLRYHPDHPAMEMVKNESEPIGYKCLLQPFGREVSISSISDLKCCLLSVCKELRDIHSLNVILNDIRWANICHDEDRGQCFLIDFDEARIVKEEEQFICPGIDGLNRDTHWNVHIPHSFETDLWAIGNLLVTAQEVGLQSSIPVRTMGHNIMQTIQRGEALSLEQIVEMIQALE